MLELIKKKIKRGQIFKVGGAGQSSLCACAQGQLFPVYASHQTKLTILNVRVQFMHYDYINMNITLPYPDLDLIIIIIIFEVKKP